jgi:hypothetical protein
MKLGRWGTVTVLTGLLIGLAPSVSPAITIPNGTNVDAGTYPAGFFCPFPVHVEYVVAQIPRTETNITGPASVTVTNLSTNQSLTYNASGPATRTGFQGLTFLGQPASMSPNTFLIITSGHPTFNPDNTLASLNGTILHDICAELA